MVNVWWAPIGVIHCSFLGTNQSITRKAEIYSNELADMHPRLREKGPTLLNRLGQILFHDIEWTRFKNDFAGTKTWDTRLCHIFHILQIFHLLIIIFFKHEHIF